jgi:hypothetical protein
MGDFNFNSTIEYFNKNKKYTNKEILRCPDWMTEDDDFKNIYPILEEFYEHGKIKLSCIVQANNLLFKGFFLDCPANFIYTDDPYYLENPLEFYNLATDLFSLKGKENPIEDEEFLARVLADEFERVFNYTVPKSITNGREVKFTSLMVHRKHLPKRKLCNIFYPLLVLEDSNPDAIILPKWYWKY